MKMHQVVVLGEPMVQACERTWNNFCRLCVVEGESQVVPEMGVEAYRQVAVSVGGMEVPKEVFYDLLGAMIEVFIARGDGFDATWFVGEAERARFGGSSLL